MPSRARARGPTLRERIGEGALPAAEVARILRPVLLGAAKAHSFGLAHHAIGARLITLSDRGPVLHGMGIVPAARKEVGDPREDVRALATLALEMWAGAHCDELGEEMVRETGLERATPAIAKVLKHALEEGYPHSGALLRAFELADPRYAAGSDRLLHSTHLRRVVVGTIIMSLLAAATFLILRALQPEGDLLVQTDPGATIELHGIEDVAEVHRKGQSGPDGLERFTDVPAGDYFVRIAWKGREAEDTAQVKAHTMTSVTVFLGPLPGGFLYGCAGSHRLSLSLPGWQVLVTGHAWAETHPRVWLRGDHKLSLSLPGSGGPRGCGAWLMKAGARQRGENVRQARGAERRSNSGPVNIGDA